MEELSSSRFFIALRLMIELVPVGTIKKIVIRVNSYFSGWIWLFIEANSSY